MDEVILTISSEPEITHLCKDCNYGLHGYCPAEVDEVGFAHFKIIECSEFCEK